MSLLQTLQTAFPGLRAHMQGNDYCLEVSAPSLHDILQMLKRDMGFIFLLDIVASDQAQEKERFVLIYHLLHMELHQRLRVRVAVDEKVSLPTITDLWPAADWSQREIAEMFGLHFENQTQRRLLTTSRMGYPLRKDWQAPALEDQLEEIPKLEFPWLAHISDEERLNRHVIDINPSHPAIQGTFMVRAEVLGDQVKRVLVEVGMQHRGVEKIAESTRYAQFFPYAERLNFSSPFIGAVAWAKTVEDALGIKLTDRATAIRMVFMELARVADHCMVLSAMAQDLSAPHMAVPLLQLRACALELFESYCGSRLMGPMVCLGGLNFDLPIGWIRHCLESVRHMYKQLEATQAALTRHPAWLALQDEGPMSATEAIEWGISGPCLRACGVNYDLRKNSPYYFYDDVDFDIPLGINGDPYDRYLVRIEEIRQSLRIISQILDHIPSGDILVEENYGFETLVPSGEFYSFVESANGELGFYLISKGKETPYRLKIRTPSFFHFQSFAHFVENTSLDGATAWLSSLNAITGEIDR